MATTSRYWIIDVTHGKGYSGGKTKKQARIRSDKVLDALPQGSKVQLFDVNTKKFTIFKRGKLY